MEIAERYELARRLHGSLGARDWTTFRSLLTDDAEWQVPGHSRISGRVVGGDAVVERFRSIAGYAISFALQDTLISRENVALTFHNTASFEGRELNMRLVTVCRLAGGKIAGIETFVSDVDQLNAFFA